MSVLVILLPSRPRTDAAAPVPAEYAYVFSVDGQQPTRSGQAAAARLPRAEQTTLMLADADVGWQRITLPKAPPARRRAALGAMLEEQLLDEDEALHLAVRDDARGGEAGWVAVTQQARLAAVLADLQQAGVAVDRIAPASWPADPPTLHLLPADEEGGAARLVHGHADGVVCLRLSGTLARQRLAALDRQRLHCSAHPAVAAEAERWLGAAVEVQGEGERALRALRSPWDLRQFAFAPRHRGLQALRELLQRLRRERAWRPLRWGLAALLLVHLAGLNAYAWKLQHELRQRQQAQVALLQQAHPQVRAVLDAPLQMQRETERLREAAGQPGAADLEPMLSAAAAAWPDGQGPLQALRFEPGRLSFGAAGWSPAQQQQFALAVRAAGYEAQANAQDAQLVLTVAGAR